MQPVNIRTHLLGEDRETPSLLPLQAHRGMTGNTSLASITSFSVFIQFVFLFVFFNQFPFGNEAFLLFCRLVSWCICFFILQMTWNNELVNEDPTQTICWVIYIWKRNWSNYSKYTESFAAELIFWAHWQIISHTFFFFPPTQWCLYNLADLLAASQTHLCPQISAFTSLCTMLSPVKEMTSESAAKTLW